MAYEAPVEDILFALKSAADVPQLIESGVYDGLDEDTLRAIVEEAGKFGADVLDPLNRVGDATGATLADGQVTTPAGFAQAYAHFCEGGWNALTGPESYGGQDLPGIVASATTEIWNASNLSFALCPLLTMGAIDALMAHGSKDLIETYLPKMVSGEWPGTMNLTEP
ncbi:MAG: acyl-CoA dehydrogenase family protein, partial [Hyphomicrobiaceae bacterium]